MSIGQAWSALDLCVKKKPKMYVRVHRDTYPLSGLLSSSISVCTSTTKRLMSSLRVERSPNLSARCARTIFIVTLVRSAVLRYASISLRSSLSLGPSSSFSSSSSSSSGSGSGAAAAAAPPPAAGAAATTNSPDAILASVSLILSASSKLYVSRPRVTEMTSLKVLTMWCGTVDRAGYLAAIASAVTRLSVSPKRAAMSSSVMSSTLAE
mmetsp:Transcript_9548/g.29948  ORF Transcript_9548/g.29948 Transcript_9548/m.29948 type:complete len:209 (+) Transcript_9548:425-1051(+)